MMNTGSGSGLDDFEHRDDAYNNDHFEAESDEELDQDAPLGSNNKRRRYHRHSPYQIQNLEA